MTAGHIGDRIRLARDAMALTQQVFADGLGVHVVTVSNWERGDAFPSVANLLAIAAFTGRDVGWFTDPTVPAEVVA